MKFVFLSLMILFPMGEALARAKATPQEASVVATGSMWSVPGYSSYDCADEKNKPRYKNADVQYVCENSRGDVLESGETVDLVLDSSGKPVAKNFEVKGNEDIYRIFYLVKNPATGKEGWMSSEYISEPREKVFEAPRPALRPEVNCDCGDPKATNSGKINSLRSDAEAIADVTSKLTLGKVKMDTQISRFMCMYRDSSVSLDKFNQIMPAIKRSAKNAEKAFGIPASVLQCAMLVESALVSSASSEAHARGYPQFLSGTVRELGKVIDTRDEFSDQWAAYKALEPKATMTEESIRTRSTIESSMGAIALYLKVMETDYVQKSCKDCSSQDDVFTRKEIYLLMAGYNAGPGVINKISGKSAVQLMSSNPPPSPTRAYFMRMDRCLQGDYDAAFVATPEAIIKANSRRKSALKELEKRQQLRATKGVDNPELEMKMNAQKANLQKLISMNASTEYEYLNRAEECIKGYPDIPPAKTPSLSQKSVK